MKLLMEVEEATGKLISATPNGIAFSELPGTSISCTVGDAEMAERIWNSHINGGQVIVTVDAQWNFISADVEDVTPPDPPKTAEEQRIESLEAENADLKGRLGDVELALADLFAGGV